MQEPEAGGAIHARRVRALEGFLTRRGVPRADAADYAQETYLRALEARMTFATDRDWMTWAFVVARNLIASDLRRPERQTTLVGEMPEDAVLAPGADQELMAGQCRRALGRVLASLPEQQREALLATSDGKPPRRIADEWQVSSATVWSTLQRARRTAREDCRRQGLRPMVWVPSCVAALFAGRPRLRETCVVPVCVGVAGIAMLTATGLGTRHSRHDAPLPPARAVFDVRDPDVSAVGVAASGSVSNPVGTARASQASRSEALTGRIGGCAKIPALGARACAGREDRGYSGYRIGVRVPRAIAGSTGVESVQFDTGWPPCDGVPHVGGEVLICSRSNDTAGPQ